MRIRETRMVCKPSWLASIMRMTRNMPKRRLFTFEAFPFREWLTSGRGQEAFGGPAIHNPLLGSMVMQPQLPTPYHKWLRLASVSYEIVDARVRALLNTSGPTTVSRFVVAVIVDSVDALFVRPLTHVFEEVLENKPSVTNLNTACAVPLKVLAGRVGASLNHRGPDIVDAAPRAPMSFSWLPRRSAFLAPTAAGFGPAITPKKRGMHLAFSAAGAAAKVNGLIMSAFASILQHSPSVESLASKVFHALMMDQSMRYVKRA